MGKISELFSSFVREIRSFTGTRSSAVQILPQIQPIVKRLTTFIRSPSWVVPLIGSSQHAYTEDEIESFVRNPAYLTTLRKKNEAVANSIFSMISLPISLP